jgi:N,N'-diacetyllegionaminate synthase
VDLEVPRSSRGGCTIYTQITVALHPPRAFAYRPCEFTTLVLRMSHWLELQTSTAPATLIAEVAQAHDGSLGMAHAFIDAAAGAGVHAVKFQTHIASEESTASEPWRVKFSKQDETRFDYWKRMEFSAEAWAGLKLHAEDKGLIFLSSAFSHAAVDVLRKLGMSAWKVASGELTNLPLIEHMASDGKPVLLSTGMSPHNEIDSAAVIVRNANAPMAIFQCTTQYPSPPESIGLNMLDELQARHSCAVGLSDHSGTIFPTLAAVAAHHAQLIEVHLTLSRDMFGPDVVASVTPSELKQLVEGVRFIENMAANPVQKNAIDPRTAPMRQIFFKSVVPLRDLKSGTTLTRDMLGLKKPGTGIPAAELGTVIGRVLAHDVVKDMPLQHGDLK